jgi:hypothetical protein
MIIRALILILLGSIYGCKTDSISDSQKQHIVDELKSIKAIDQEYSGIPPQEMTDKYGYNLAWKIFLKKRDSIGLSNQERIKKLYETYGYLGYDKVGKEASQNFWISIQHADNDIEFQQEMLIALKAEISKNNASKSEYAMLEDRVNVNLGNKQKFGTPVTYNAYGQAIPKNGLIDSVNIESFRKEYDLPPLLEYYNEMTRMYFEMNKSNMTERGITEPKLYQ